MQITVGEIGKLLNAEIVGDAAAVISKVAKIEEGTPEALSFLSNLKYESFLYNTGSTAVLVNRSFIPSRRVRATLIKVDDAYSSFTFLLKKFGHSPTSRKGIHPTAHVAATAKIGQDVYVGPFAVIDEHAEVGEGTYIGAHVYIGEKSKIGAGCIFHPGVNIMHECEIGNNCIFQGGVVIGSDGFGFAPNADRSYTKIPQTGNVIIEDDVEIGANSTVDRATMGSTIIRKGVKLDNLVQIAHNVEIGEHTVIASQSGVAGSSRIGKYCVIAGQVGFVGHISVADGSVIGAQSGISNSITEPNKKWFSSPAFELKDALRSAVIYKQLPQMEKRIKELESRLASEKKTNK
jgi:UDP-3-O-[3-hydroxymyristoyl] glucosamine N-acyltransferase